MHSIVFNGITYQTSGELPTIGSRAPDFSLVSTELTDLTLSQFMGKRKIYNTFPSIDMAVCAQSVKVFDRLLEGQENIAALMISYDLPFAHERFQLQNELQNVTGLSAIRHAGFGENYGVQIVEGPLAGMLSRAIIVLDENDTVVHREQIEDINDSPDYEAAFRALGITVELQGLDDE